MSTEELQQQDAPATGEEQDGTTVEVNEEQEAAPSQDDAAFQEGFDAARNGGEPEPEPEPPKLIAGYTEDQVKELLQKAGEVDRLKERESKMFGTLGALRQAVDALKERPSAQATAPVSIALKRLAEHYPEMAESLAEDLRESLAGGSAQVDVSALEKSFGDRLEVVTKANETKLLSVMHPDWKVIPSTPEFAQWKGTLAPDELQVVQDSWDAISVGEALSKFKAWKAQTVQAKQQRQSRLEAAVTPRGTRQPTPSMTEQDAFVAGFKSVRG